MLRPPAGGTHRRADVCVQRGRTYIKLANRDVSSMANGRSYLFAGEPNIGPALLNAHVEVSGPPHEVEQLKAECNTNLAHHLLGRQWGRSRTPALHPSVKVRFTADVYFFASQFRHLQK